MTEGVNQHDQLIRYLLGMASDTERGAVEEQFFASDADLNELLQVEDELIDDYVRGALSTSDRRLFESNFLCTKKRRQRLELVQSLVQVLGEMDSETSVSSERTVRSLPLRERAAGARLVALSKQLSLASFTELLRWLDPDRERAAEKYETIRNRLIKIFAVRGFENPEDLADDTFDRVASKAAHLKTYVGDPAAYFYGVARAVMMAGDRRPLHELVPPEIGGNEKVSDQVYSCLERCLENLSASNRDLILQYYGSEKPGKAAKRAELAQHLGISQNAMRLRIFTIRQDLENCIRSCLKVESDQVDVNNEIN